jgi:NAD(P)-dependent dehydrogenase (short-subunit alcohol dehydrogenase family)
MSRTGNCASCSVQAASKAALISLAKTMSAELLPRGVHINVVSPRPVTTLLYGKLGFDAATRNRRPPDPDADSARTLGKRKSSQRRRCISPWPNRGFMVGAESWPTAAWAGSKIAI